MVTKRKSRKSATIGPAVLGKPNGVIQPRVQIVGPERFGIVAVDCAKARSKWMLCDFYGKVLIPPTVVEHQRPALQIATFQVRDACQEFGLQDHIVAVEMTGTYHRPVQRAFRQAGSETRLVHPFASRHYRLPAHADNKTDDHDLEGIFRAAVNGFGLLEPLWDETEPDPPAIHLTPVWHSLHDDWLAKTRQIDGLEQELLEILAKTPYVLLLSHPGIGVVTAAELAGEMGPLEHYAHAKAITGRAGLFPSRYQSDEVDRADGPLARHRNARLRAAWLRVADNLIKCNAHFRGKFQLWKQRGVDARDIRCRIANRAARTVFQMAGVLRRKSGLRFDVKYSRTWLSGSGINVGSNGRASPRSRPSTKIGSGLLHVCPSSREKATATRSKLRSSSRGKC
jgi:transposase